MKKIVVVICGGGNLGHAAACLLGGREDLSVSILTRKPHLWSHTITAYKHDGNTDQVETLLGHIDKITSEASSIIPLADVVILTAPIYVHGAILKNIADYLKEHCILGSVFSQGGFDWIVNKYVYNIQHLNFVFGLQHVPWICRINEYGKSVTITGFKRFLVCSCYPNKSIEEAKNLIENLFGIPTQISGNFLSLTLASSNQIIHPARYYGIFHKFDGVTPLCYKDIQWNFYTDMDEISIEYMEKLDQELQLIRDSIIKINHTIDLSNSKPLKERLIGQYGNAIADSSTLLSIFRTNKSYYGCKTPVLEIESGQQYLPLMTSRFFWEDIPYGLCVLKSLAQMMNLITPTIDFLINWHQKLMNKNYLLENGKLNLQLVNEMGIPESYGINSIEEIITMNVPEKKL